MNFILEMILRAEGLTEEQITKIEADIPYFRELLALSVEAKPLLVEAQALYEKGKPTVAKGAAIWAKVQPDIDAILAALQKSGALAADSTSPGSRSGGGIGS